MKRKLSRVSVLLSMLAILAVVMAACGGAPQEYISTTEQSVQQQDGGVSTEDFRDTIRPVVNSFEGIMDRLIALLDDLDAVDTMDDLAAWGNRLTETNQQAIVIIEGLESFVQFAPQELIGSFNQLIAAADSIHLAMNQLDEGVEAGIRGDDDEFFRLVGAFEADFNAASAQWSAALAAM